MSDERMARLASHVVTPHTPPCGLCDDTGWARAATVSGTDAVIRCRCSKGQVSDGHSNVCTCLTCHYGEDRAAQIANGRDGMSRRSGKGSDVDPLAQPVSGRQTWGEE